MHSILVYHTIDKTDAPTACAETISPERFEEQLRWLSRRRRVVSLEETLTRSPKDSVVAITFDDGYRDNLTIALPLLEKYSLPMTLFVVAAFVGTEGYLSEEELREMARHPLVTIGSHGFSHPNFSLLGTDEARFELKESRQRLEEITGGKVDLLAWPYGECNPELERLSGASGYRASWSVWKGTNGAHSRWRVPLGGRDHMIRFIAKSSGLYALTEARLHRAKAGRYSVPVTTATGGTPMTTTV